MDEITLQVVRDEESGWLVASWDAPGNAGGITTHGEDLQNEIALDNAHCFQDV